MGPFIGGTILIAIAVGLFIVLFAPAYEAIGGLIHKAFSPFRKLDDDYKHRD